MHLSFFQLSSLYLAKHSRGALVHILFVKPSAKFFQETDFKIQAGYKYGTSEHQWAFGLRLVVLFTTSIDDTFQVYDYGKKPTITSRSLCTQKMALHSIAFIFPMILR